MKKSGSKALEEVKNSVDEMAVDDKSCAAAAATPQSIASPRALKRSESLVRNFSGFACIFFFLKKLPLHKYLFAPSARRPVNYLI